ncbi:very low-density lipoprotein receptor-like isoform X2 [Mizuhopecten yessoensis]|uniref:Very low-density lipoprotein receptor n=1 Tax=Mizuhopecten yessoensis TaxID=6573 RepID=A0A210PPZ7_MIZYE|nr:very low-density lipoprotein receptor-like isoform X2 [Mizuhopecten yessoensis]OWF38579.1 Very low-density lipoprotein receptor [Mizuhopecten yessoensis]
MKYFCWRVGLLTFLLVISRVAYASEDGNPCPKDRFHCGNNICISMDWKCDGTYDCQESHADELGCEYKACKSEEFNCGNNTLCIPISWKCDQDADCPNGLDETVETCANPCKDDEFSCGDGKCIPSLWVCDEMSDCSDGRDEQTCSAKTCSSSEFQCTDHQCVAGNWRCDGDTDCRDGSDEIDCSPVEECSGDHFKCNNSQCLPENWHCDGDHDCDDHSDEFRCDSLVPNCEIEEWNCATSDQCIHLSWRCDGDNDCFDESDEVNCTRTCASNEFKCDNNQCINSILRCDGENECADASDEANCQKTCDNTTQFSCQTETGFQCLPAEKVCDGHIDCLNDEDERKCTTGVDPCLEHNGGCAQKCVKMFRNEFRCECFDGYRLVGNNFCEDVNECKPEDGKQTVCSQGCQNHKGGYKCSCIEGYTLDPHGFCRVNGIRPHLLVANRFDIRTLQVDTWWEQTVLEDLTSAVAVDFDYNDGYLFWTDITKEQIFRARKTANGSAVDEQVIVSDNVKTPDGIAVDWIYNHVYWTDAKFDKIEVMSYDGQKRRNLVTKGLDEPRAIVVDPLAGWMYWTDWGKKPMISRCGLNGKHQSVIVQEGIEWPNGLTIDYVDHRLFWIDAKLKLIRSVDTNGGSPYTVLHDAQSIIHPFAITVFEDDLYWTDWKAESIRTVNKFRGDGYHQVAIGLHSPMDIHFYHENVQKNGTNHCGNNNGQCSDFCLPSPQGNNVTDDSDKTNGFSCVCRNNYKLDSDQKTCVPDIVDISTPTPSPIPTSTNSTKNTTATRTTESPNKVPVSNHVTTARPKPVSVKPTTAKPKPTTAEPVVTTQVPEMTTQGAYTVIVPTSQTNKTDAGTPSIQDSGEKVGLIAGIVIAVVVVVFIIIAVVGFVFYRRYTNRNIKSMNFDNPVYRKTTEDHQFIIPYGNRDNQSRRDNSNNPALQPLTKHPEV